MFVLLAHSQISMEFVNSESFHQFNVPKANITIKQLGASIAQQAVQPAQQPNAQSVQTPFKPLLD